MFLTIFITSFINASLATNSEQNAYQYVNTSFYNIKPMKKLYQLINKTLLLSTKCINVEVLVFT